MSMHDHFANWYRLASVDPKSETLENRWKAIEAFAEAIDFQKALELVRSFYALPIADQNAIDEYKAAFKANDSTFLMKDNDFEVRVLAGASLIQLLEESGPTEINDVTALAVMCGFCQGMRTDLLNQDVINAAQNYLSGEAIRVRTIGKIPSVESNTKDTEKIFGELKTALESNTVPGIKDQLTAVLKKLKDNTKHVADTANKASAKLSTALNIQREETNILWWLFGEYSRDLNRPFSALDLSVCSLVAGKELADLTEFLPGIYASRGHLDRVLHPVTKTVPTSTTIRDAVNAIPKEWSTILSTDQDATKLFDLCPLHSAIDQAASSAKPNDWLASFDKRTGLKSKKTIAALDLSVQFYQERLLIRAVE